MVRLYAMSFADGVWTLTRESPDFTPLDFRQRFTGTFSTDGNTPDVTHSRNIAVRPEVGIAIFDSHAAIGAGQGVYMSAAAALLDGGEAARGIEAFSARSVAHGAT